MKNCIKDAVSFLVVIAPKKPRGFRALMSALFIFTVFFMIIEFVLTVFFSGFQQLLAVH